MSASLGSLDGTFADLSRNEARDTIPFYQAEGQILELWDQVQELKLEQALLQAQTTSQSEELQSTDEAREERLKDAEKEYVEARASYLLRQDVIEDILVADPILKAVHAGANATTTERDLHPLIDRRDGLGIAQANLSSNLQSVLRGIMSVEAKNIKARAINKELSAIILDISTKIKDLREESVEDLRLRAQLDRAEANSAVAKQRWRIMKSVVSATIVGSGVDWVRNEGLRDFVLDDEEDRDGD